MADIDDNILRSSFNAADYAIGKKLYDGGAVRDFHEDKTLFGYSFTCECADGGERRHLTGNCIRNRIFVRCECQDYRYSNKCRHMVAALLYHMHGDPREAAYRQMQYVRPAPKPPRVRSDQSITNMLAAYENADTLAIAGENEYHNGEVQVLPVLHTEEMIVMDDYPMLSLKIGVSKQYVVKDIEGMLRDIKAGNELHFGVTNGKAGFTLLPTTDAFDEKSKQLLALANAYYQTFHTMFLRNRDTSASALPAANKNRIRLSDSDFIRFFDMYKGTTVAGPGSTKVLLTEGDPTIGLEFGRDGNVITLRVLGLNGARMRRMGDRMYYVSRERVLRCSEEFTRKMGGLLTNISSGEALLRIAPEDMPSFCSCVLPEIREYTSVVDRDTLLESYEPTPCTACFYFDMENNVLSGRLRLRYNGREYAHDRQIPGVIRNVRTEKTALEAMRKVFCSDFPEKNFLEDEDAIDVFLTSGAQALQTVGEVFFSDSIKSRVVRPSRPQVGVSVSDGIITLDVDTGEFPPEELEALYKSLLTRKKYHKLKNGKVMDLSDPSYNTLAEVVHMTQLAPQQLASGHVQLPAYRAMYLDTMLTGGHEIALKRDGNFREMVRRFKTVDDSDFQLPEPLQGVLRPYQEAGFRWLKTLESCNFGGILADDMGLGKTLQVIAFLATVNYAEKGMPSLVVTPTSLVLNWEDEIKKFAPWLKTTLVIGTAAQRKAIFREKPETDVWITSYDTLRRDIDSYDGLRFYTCVLDEGQFVKNQSTLASKAVKRVNCVQRFVMTGTPIENRLSELWNLFDFLMPGYLFTNNRFVENLEKPIVKEGSEESLAQLNRLVQPFILRRLKKDVLKDLPPKVEMTRRIPLSDEERRIYAAQAAAARKQLSSASGKLAILAAFTRLRQICCDPNLAFSNYAGPTSKLDACIDLVSGLAENGHRILLFSQFTSMLDIIRKKLNELGISSFTIQGSTGKEERAELVRDFNNGQAQVFLISLKAGGTGLNLTAADVVIHYDPWWNRSAENQATDRAHRIGQTQSVQVYKLICENTIEERIRDLQDRKMSLMDSIATVGGEGGATGLTASELLSLLEEHDTPQTGDAEDTQTALPEELLAIPAPEETADDVIDVDFTVSGDDVFGTEE